MSFTSGGAADPVPTLEELDRQLAFWENQVSRVQANLDLLQQTPSYVFIGGGLRLTGRTQAEVSTPILAAHDLADQYELLAGQVAKARLLRSSIRPFLRSNNTLREIDQLLNKPSVRFAANQVPLAQRNLLDDPVAQSHLSLQQLVDVMTQAFDAARDAVTRYDQVMAKLTPELAAADRQLAALDDRAAKLGSQATAAVQSLRTSLQETRRQTLDDPLAAQVGFDQTLQQRLRQLGDQLGAIEQERDGVRDQLARAQARQARAERVRGFNPAQVAGLREWLADIASTVQAGQHAAARIGLQRWNAEADGPYTAEEQRQEQLGLLKALRTMAQRRRERGAQIDPDLDGVALEAEAALRHDPPDLLRAAQLVERYQRGVTAS